MFYMETKPNSGTKPWTFQIYTLGASVNAPILAIGTGSPHQRAETEFFRKTRFLSRNVFSRNNAAPKTKVVVPVR